MSSKSLYLAGAALLAFAGAATLGYCNPSTLPQPKGAVELPKPQRNESYAPTGRELVKNDTYPSKNTLKIEQPSTRKQTLPNNLEFVLRTYLADELAHYEDWDTKATFLGQYKRPVLDKARQFKVGDITSYLDKNPEIKASAEKLFGADLATLYSLRGKTPDSTLGDLITENGGPTTDSLGETLWDQVGGIWGEKGKRDLVQRMFMDQDVDKTLKQSLGGNMGIAGFYNTIAENYLGANGVQIPPTLQQDLINYYHEKQTQEEREKTFNRINGVFARNRISYEQLGSRVLEALQKKSGLDALGAFMLHHKNPRAFQLEKKK